MFFYKDTKILREKMSIQKCQRPSQWQLEGWTISWWRYFPTWTLDSGFSTQLPGLSESMFSKAKSLWSAAIALGGRKTFKEEGPRGSTHHWHWHVPHFHIFQAMIFSSNSPLDVGYATTMLKSNADTLLLTWMVCSAWHRGWWARKYVGQLLPYNCLILVIDRYNPWRK